MTFRQFAFNNVFRNMRLYIAYFLSSLFTVSVFFTFANFAFHPSFSGEEINSSVMTGMAVAGGIIYVFSFFFILYSMSAFLQSRKKEFGVLMIQGMSSYQIRWMVFLENMIIGIFSTVIGIGLGLLFSKAILLIADNILEIDEVLNFYMPTMAIVITFVSFMILFLFISFFVTFILRTNKLIKLIKGDEIGKSEPKASIVLTILAVVLLGGGYAIALLVKGFAVAIALLPVAILVTIGTYLLFSQISVYIISKLKKNKKLFWKKTNMLLFSDLSYRMKDNARSFFIVAIISTVAFSAIGGLVGLKSLTAKGITEVNPISFTYYSDEIEMTEAELTKDIEFIEGTFKEHNIEVDKIQVDLNYYKQVEDTPVLIVTGDDYNQYADLIGKDKLTVGENELIKVKGSGAVVDVNTRSEEEGVYTKRISDLESILLADGSEFKVTDTVTNNNIIPETGTYYVVNQNIYEKLSDPVRSEKPFHWEVTSGKENDVIDAGALLLEKYMNDMVAIDALLHLSEQIFGPIMFVGLFIGIIFFVSAGSFLYFRLYSDLEDDKAKFRSISKIGLTFGEMKRVISRQTAILFFAPIIVAIVHGAVALTALAHLFEDDLTRVTMLVLGSFLAIQIVYYLFVRHFYLRQIKRAIE